ncbi:uncharacterized protein SAPINGB_P005035 [Magnusiomyces paraingens]|uniref:AMP-dependent synthetase/ligase domain-containing protein n=1 Tax=Magnusiomyces paraingens TaxID=2606893 RepID=A0A5E8BZ66_9ASCO|nr:uncharacterized protein SAPINGB_P005035 [Saprochaete ingens]VVT56392.1 unnamed protein product [Saprochaete ingens]
MATPVKIKLNNRVPVTVPVGEAKEGETAPRRNIGARDGPWLYPDNNPQINTIYNLLIWAEKEYSSLPAMASRKIVDVHTEIKTVSKKVEGKIVQQEKQWQFFELSPYSYISYKELLDLVNNYAAGLLQIGIKPKGQENCHIYAQTSAYWLQTALALNANAIPAATAYDTLGEDGLTHALTQTGSVAVFCDNNIVGSLASPLQQATNVRIIVTAEPMTKDSEIAAKEKVLAVNSEIKFYTFQEVIDLGKQNYSEPIGPEPEDVALIMYTSGSTGPPKGVVLTNRNVIGAIGGISGNIGHDIIPPGSRLLAYLPLAHILEFTFELAVLFWGGVLGYGTVKTISDVSVRKCAGDIREFKPNVMIGVPAVWETVRKGILSKVGQLSPIAQKIFWTAYRTKLRLLNHNIPCPLVDNLIFKKIKDATGGNLRIVLNGGAAVSRLTQEFITTLICPMVIGYGLTETNAMCTIMRPSSFSFETIGELTHAVTVKLVDVQEAGYHAKNNQGEVYIKSASVANEYYKNKEETDAAFTDDGYFRTGDIGQWTETGHLKLIDRRKNLIKTLNGEYIALEKLESLYRSNQYIINICVYADEFRVKPIAIVVTNPANVEKLASELGVEHHEDIAHDPKVKSAIEKSMLQTGKDAGLKGIELILGTVISHVEWTPQNGFLTSAQKLDRKKILADNKAAIDELYDSAS